MVCEEFYPNFNAKCDGILRGNQNWADAQERQDDGAQGRQRKAGIGAGDVRCGFGSRWKPVFGEGRGKSTSGEETIGDPSIVYHVRRINQKFGIE